MITLNDGVSALAATANTTAVYAPGHEYIGLFVKTTALTGTSPTLVVKIQESAAGSTYYDIGSFTTASLSSATSTRIAVPTVGTKCAGWLRAVCTVGGSNTTATLVVQDLTYTAVTSGSAGNSVTIAYTAGATAGAEVVTVVGNAISIKIQSGTSTATQVRTAFNASAAAIALATCTVSGTGSTAQTTAAVTPLASGADLGVTFTAYLATVPSIVRS